MNNYLNISQLAQDVFDGIEDPLKAYGIAKAFLKEVTDATKLIEEAALDEASKHEKTFIHEGYKFERRNGARRFDFKHLPDWAEKKQELSDIEGKYKSAYQSFERGLKQVTEDGEVIELPKVTFSKDSLIVKSNE